MHSDTEPSPAEIQAGLNGVVRDLLRPAALMLAAAHVCYTLAHAVQLPPGERGVMMSLDGATVLAGVLLWVYFSRAHIPHAMANHWVGVMLVLALGNFGYQVYLTPRPALAIFLVLIVVAAGCFFLSWGYMAVAVLGSAGVWIWGMVLNPEGPWWDVVHIFVIGVILGLLVHGLRWRTYRRYEVLKQQLERTADRLERRLEFEHVLTRVSARFLALSPEEIEAVVAQSMQSVGECLEVDHVFVSRVDDGSSPALNVIYEWCHPEAAPCPHEIKHVPTTSLPWCWDRLKADETVRIVRPADLSDEAKADRMFLEETGIRSFFAVPIPMENRTWGLLGLAAVRKEVAWSEDTASLLKILGEIIVASLRRKSAEDEISSLNRQLEQASRLVGLGDMAANLAHDLGNGLSAVLQFTQGANRRSQRGSLTLDQCCQCILDIEEQAEYMRKILLMMQQFVRTRTTERVPIHLPEVIKQSALLVQGKLRQNCVSLSIAEPPNVPPLFADPAQISIVLVNLLLNSAQAMAKMPPENRRIRLEVQKRDADFVEVSIHDQGPGVPPELREKVFEKFYTTKKEGLGLGLAFSRSYIEAHGGKIWCDPHVKTGCEFRFQLPLGKTKSPGC